MDGADYVALLGLVNICDIKVAVSSLGEGLHIIYPSKVTTVKNKLI